MLCSPCNERQQSLLEAGDGSQVVCGHLIIDDPTTSTALDKESCEHPIIDRSAVEATTTSPAIVNNVVASSSTTAVAPVAVDTVSGKGSRKRKFMSFKRFTDLAGDKMKRKIVPIAKWTTLTERTPYLAKKIITIDTVVNGKPKIGHYAELEDKDQKTLNVWITDIIREDLEKYSLHEEQTYIMPLGDTISKETGYPYHDFTILEDKE